MQIQFALGTTQNSLFLPPTNLTLNYVNQTKVAKAKKIDHQVLPHFMEGKKGKGHQIFSHESPSAVILCFSTSKVKNTAINETYVRQASTTCKSYFSISKNQVAGNL